MEIIRSRLWTAQDVADYLGIPRKSLYNWRCRGIGPRARRVGRYLRYDDQDVRAWFAARDDAVR
jgi:predicted DNA-binding transcriptional regulator AlpA